MSLSIGELVGYVGIDTSAGEASLDRFGSFLEGKGGAWGKTLAKTGAVVGGAFAASLVGAINVEPSRDRVAAALDLTKEEAARVGKVSGDLYADAWGQSAEEVDAALEAVVSSIKGMRKASEGELRDVAEAALTLSTTMGVDVVRASQVAGNMIANGMARDGVQAMDLLAAAMSKVPVQLREDVLDATDEYGQFFNALGIKGPKAMALLAASAGKGMYGIDKMGDAIKEFTILATDGSSRTTEALTGLGLDADELSNKLLAGGPKANKAFDEIVAAILKVKDPTKQASAALALFGTPLEDLGTKDIPKFLRSMQTGAKGLGDFKGATERMGETLNDNAATNLSGFTRKVKSAFVDMLGGKVLPKVTDFTAEMDQKFGPALEKAGDVLQSVTGWFKDHMGVTKGLIGVIVALTAVTAAHAAVMAVSAAGGLAKWLLQTKLISAATKVWAAVQWALNAAMMANPITLVVVAIAALIAGLVLAYTKVGWFRDGVNAAFDWIKNAAKAVGKFFTDTLPGFFSKAWNKVVSVTKSIVGGYIGFYRSIPGRIWSGLSSLGGKLGSVFRSAWNGALNITKNIGGTVVGWITGIPGKLGGLGKKFGEAGKDLLQKFIDGMKNAAGIISGIAGNVWNAVKGLLNGAIDKINSALEFTIDLPGPKNLEVNLPDIPRLATGGRATRETLAVIGEGREPESVLPDSVLRGLLERAHNAGRASAEAGGRGDTWNVYQQPDESADVLAERLWFKTRTRPA